MSVEAVLGIALILSLLSVGFLIYLLVYRKPPSKTAPELDLLLRQMNEIQRNLDAKLGESSKAMHEAVRAQFGESQRLIKDITAELTSVKETGRQVVSFADQLKNLQDILKNPKQRGVLGEYYLETVLKNVLPPNSYQMQYAFPNGEIVDAVVFVKDKIIPVDSKFSLENYNRILESRDTAEKERLEKAFKQDLKLRIDETSKYVRPDQDTTEFAFMFIPSEGIYYDILVGSVGTGISARDLIDYAFGKKVIIVSPTSFLAYLQTVLQGLKALQIEESAKQIRKNVEDLGKHLKKYEEYHGKLGNALSITVNHYNAAGKELTKVDKDILRIAGESPEIEATQIDGPDKEGE